MFTTAEIGKKNIVLIFQNDLEIFFLNLKVSSIIWGSWIPFGSCITINNLTICFIFSVTQIIILTQNFEPSLLILILKEKEL